MTPEPLQLERPLAVIDTESTGLRPETARIVRISVFIVRPDGSVSQRSELVNPGTPIPPGATAVHGITEEDVMDQPPFRAFARGLAQALEDCDLAGFAIERFHLPLLLAEFHRAGVEFSMDGRAVVDMMAIYHRLEPRDFEAAYRTYTGSEAPDRSSGLRVEAAFRILKGQLAAAPELPHEPKALARWAKGVPETAVDDEGRFAYLESGEIVFNFGKHTGETLASVVETDSSYIEWVASNQSFSADARKVAAEALKDAWEEA
jgi:DNA polymerase-3 subunit epsilon